MYWIIGVAVVTIPEGMVNGPERVVPKSSVFKAVSSSYVGGRAIILVWSGLDDLAPIMARFRSGLRASESAFSLLTVAPESAIKF